MLLSDRRAARWLQGLLLCSLMLGLLLGCQASDDDVLVFTVTFESAAGLESGMPVFHRGLEIGEVTRVGLDSQGLVEIEVVVEAEYRSAVAENSVIRSETRGLRRRLRLTVEDGEGERITIENGAVIEGHPRVLDDVLSRMEEGAVKAWQSLSDSARELQGELAEAAEQGREEFRRIRREQAPELRRQAEQVRRQLEEAGMTEEAEKYWAEFEAWLEGLESSDGNPETPLPDAPSVPSRDEEK